MARKAVELKDPHSCLSRAAMDEPLFVIRSTDKGAITAVLGWINSAYLAGAPQEKLDAAYETLRDMMSWQRQHPDRVKTPD